MAREDASKILDKDFVMLKIDTDRMKGGKEILDATRGKGKGIPFFEFRDDEGVMLVDSQSDKGNIGCPNKDSELDYFISMIKKVMAKITEEDLAALRRSLVEHREKK